MALVHSVERGVIAEAAQRGERDALRVDNAQIKEWLESGGVTAPPRPTTPTRTISSLESLSPLSDLFPSNADARWLWTTDPPMALMRELLRAGHVALRRQRDRQPLSASFAGGLVAPIRALLANQAASAYSDDDLVAIATLSATRVEQRAPLASQRPPSVHYDAFIAEAEQTHADLAAVDLADLWAVSVLPYLPTEELTRQDRAVLRRSWSRKLREYRARTRQTTQSAAINAG